MAVGGDEAEADGGDAAAVVPEGAEGAELGRGVPVPVSGTGDGLTVGLYEVEGAAEGAEGRVLGDGDTDGNGSAGTGPEAEAVGVGDGGAAGGTGTGPGRTGASGDSTAYPNTTTAAAAASPANGSLTPRGQAHGRRRTPGPGGCAGRSSRTVTPAARASRACRRRYSTGRSAGSPPGPAGGSCPRVISDPPESVPARPARGSRSI
ncbi:hypothetical protein [Streptomyces sp. NPDC059957]|uniref:hypothetical protein n=1 Tax=unclassified Streptomyces TaxID=2593676 RepID=UPI003652D16C